MYTPGSPVAFTAAADVFPLRFDYYPRESRQSSPLAPTPSRAHSCQCPSCPADDPSPTVTLPVNRMTTMSLGAFVHTG